MIVIPVSRSELAMNSADVTALKAHVAINVRNVEASLELSFGLLCVIWGCSRLRSGVVPFAVASYITAAYWFTSSTSFANPAVTLARSLTNTFTGIRPVDVPLFVVAQVAGALSATFLFRWLASNLHATACQVLVPTPVLKSAL